jgi:serine/threonine-protein kinase RsbW
VSSSRDTRALDPTLRRYALGALCGVAGFGVSVALVPISESSIYTPLVAAAAAAFMLSGVGPAFAAIGVAWLGAVLALTDPRGSFSFADSASLVRWLVGMLVAVGIVVVLLVLERVRGELTARATAAERSASVARDLHLLAAELSSAVTPSDVARVLVGRTPGLLGAAGASLGLVEGDELVIVDPAGDTPAALPPGLRLPLDAAAPIARAARSGETTVAHTRADFERLFPDGAGLAPYAAGAVAVPLVAGGRRLGAIGLPFMRAESIDDDVVALAELAASLGGQALQRSHLYEREQALRGGLERVANLAPRFAGSSPGEVVEAVCREGRSTFGADAAQLWSVDGGTLQVAWRHPPSPHFLPGTIARVDELPGVEQALRSAEPLFVDDAWQQTAGSMLERVRAEGTRSVLRVPITISGQADRVLALIWHRVVEAPTPETLLVARRFGDHAGLALEQAERRQAQQAAARSARETDRLLLATSALAAAATPELVGLAMLEEAFRELGATAGRLVVADGDELVTVAHRGGYDDDLARTWRRFPAAADVPLARAFALGETLAFSDRDTLAREYPKFAAASRFGAWLAFALSAGGRVIGAVGLSFPDARAFSRGELDYVSALARQAAQALERALLLDTERRARARAEQLANDIAQLHAAATALGSETDARQIARLVCDRARLATGASEAALYLVDGDRLDGLSLVAGTLHLAPRALPAPTLDVPAWIGDGGAIEPGFEALLRDGAGSTAVVPLLHENETIGLFAAWFAEPPDASGRRLLETMARQAAQPLERARLLRAERDARLEAELSARRTRALQALSAALAAAATPGDVAGVLAAQLRKILAADGVVVYALDADGAHAALLAWDGFSPEVLDGWQQIPLGAHAPVTDVIASGEPLALPTPEAILERYPFATEAIRATGERSSYCYPLTAGARTLGAVYFTFHVPTAMDADGDATARAIARQGAQALDRSRLFEDEQRARMRTERLHALTAVLAGALAVEDVAEAFLRDAAAGATAASIAVVDRETRELRLVAAGGTTHELTSWERLPLSDVHPAARCVQTGRAAYEERCAHLPLASGSQTVGVATLVWEREREADGDERRFLEALAGQAALALDRSMRYESERSVAETLQRSVLPETVPAMEGVLVEARYLPGATALDVGGDWFDTLRLPDGRHGFVVGDVVGKGITAAATMAQLRNGMRALTLDESAPEETVTKLNRLLEGITDAPFATLGYLTLDPRTFGATLVSAGHLPPLVVAPDGSAAYLEGGRGLPLGVDSGIPYTSSSTTLAAGSTIVLYTDGLVERRSQSIDAGLERLQEVAGRARLEPGPLADLLVAELLGDEPRADDVAVLVVRLAETPLERLELDLDGGLGSLELLRTELEEWLAGGSIPGGDARDVVLAAWEAGANALEHAGRGAGVPVVVTAVLEGDRVRVTVSDRGVWREEQRRPDRGLGLRLIQALMTQVAIDRTDAGTTVTMERQVTATPAPAARRNG